MENRNPPILLLFLIVAAIGVKTFAPRFFDKSIVRGESFSAQIPEGWQVKKDKHQITFTSSETDILTDMPEAIFSIYAEKQKGALFMDDLFPELLTTLKSENGKILSTGDELIDGQRARWVLFRYNKPDIGVMSLYIADDYNRLTRIQFIGTLKKFKMNGKIFDAFKKSIKLKKAM